MADQLVLTVCLSPAIQKTLVVPAYHKDEVVRVEQAFTEAGGKGVFVSRVLRQLGVPVTHLTHYGKKSDVFQKLLSLEGFETSVVSASEDVRTCTTIVETEPERGSAKDPWVKSVTEIVEPSWPVSAEDSAELSRRYSSLLPDSSIVVLSGSMAPGYEPELYGEFCRQALANEALVILDIRGAELVEALKNEPHIVKINMAEFAQTFLPLKAGWIEQCEQERMELHKDLVVETLVDLTEDNRTVFILTRGPGSVWYAADGEFKEVALPNVPRHTIKNPTGSGDAFTAGVAAALHRRGADGSFFGGIPLNETQEALRFGIKCAIENAGQLLPGRIR